MDGVKIIAVPEWYIKELRLWVTATLRSLSDDLLQRDIPLYARDLEKKAETLDMFTQILNTIAKDIDADVAYWQGIHRKILDNLNECIDYRTSIIDDTLKGLRLLNTKIKDIRIVEGY
jgi:hypothetical protein